MVWTLPDQQFEELLLLSQQEVRQLRAGGRLGSAARPPRSGIQAGPKDARQRCARGLHGPTGELEPREAVRQRGDHDVDRRVAGRAVSFADLHRRTLSKQAFGQRSWAMRLDPRW